MSDVTDLCVLANAADRVGGYVRDATPIDEVRKQLLALRSGAIDVLPQHAMPQHPLAAHAKPTIAAQCLGEGYGKTQRARERVVKGD